MVKMPGRGQRGTGLKFSVKVLKAVRGFTPFTPVKYGPNPKREGSKSYDRYNRYKGAKTVGEALYLGARVADLCWELGRGDYKVLPKSAAPKKLRGLKPKDIAKVQSLLSSITGPRGLAIPVDDKNAEKELAREEKWIGGKLQRIAEYAKRLGLKLEEETLGELQGDGISENSDTRNGRMVADHLAQSLLLKRKKARAKVTGDDVTEVLRLWGFAQNSGRLNVLPGRRKWVYSDTLGAIKARCAGYGLTPPTRRYPNVCKILNQWLLDNRPSGISEDFVCTSININANYGAKTHRDGNNIGPSAIRAFGDFKGGELWYWDKDDKKANVETLQKKHARKVNIKKATLVFDGNCAHSVEGFEGERVSVVFFSARNYNRVGPKNIQFLKSRCGFAWPQDKTLIKLKTFAVNQFSTAKSKTR